MDSSAFTGIDRRMLAYWLLFLVFAAGALWFSLNPAPEPATDAASRLTATVHRNRWLFAAATFAIILVGLRYEVGTDWNTYEIIFRRISEGDLFEALASSDPAYAALNWAASALGADIWAVNLACALLFMFGVMRFARLQPNPWLAVVVAVPYLIIVVGMGYTRQAVAIGLSMAGLAAVSQGSFVRFVLWVLAGALFHRTAVVLIPLVAIAYAPNRFLATVIGLFGSLIGYYVLTRAEGMEHFQRLYVSREYISKGAGIRLAMNLAPAIIYLFLTRRFTANETERLTWRNLALVAVASFGAWAILSSTTWLDRLALYIIPLQLFVLSRIPIAFARGERRSVFLVVAVVGYSAAILFVWLNYAAHAIDWIPYQMYGLRD